MVMIQRVLWFITTPHVIIVWWNITMLIWVIRIVIIWWCVALSRRIFSSPFDSTRRFAWEDDHTPIMGMKLFMMWIQLWHKHEVDRIIVTRFPHESNSILRMLEQRIHTSICSSEHTAIFKVHLRQYLLPDTLKSRTQFNDCGISWFSDTSLCTPWQLINLSQSLDT